MVTTKKIKDTEKEMKRESTWHTRKKSIKHKWKLYWRNWGKRDVTCRKQIAQWQGKKSSSLSVITLNVNGLNSPIKRQKSAKWIFFFLFFFLAKWILKRHDLTIYCPGGSGNELMSQLIGNDWCWERLRAIGEQSCRGRDG